MKSKLTPLPHIKAVNYQWTSGGITCHGRTVLMSSTKAGLRKSFRRFWQQNLHIQPQESQ